MSNQCSPDQHDWVYRDHTNDKIYYDCVNCGERSVQQVQAKASSDPVHCRSYAAASVEGTLNGLITYITEQNPTMPQILDHLTKLSNRYHERFAATIKEIEAGGLGE